MNILAKLNKLKTNTKKVFVFILILFFFAFGFLFINFMLSYDTPILIVFNISFSPGGNIVASSPSVFFWRFDNGQIIENLSYDSKRNPIHSASDISFSSNTRYHSFSTSVDKTSIFKTSSGEEITSFDCIKSFFSDDGKSIIAIRKSKNGFIELFEQNFEEKKSEIVYGKITIDDIKQNHEYYLKPIKDRYNKSFVVFACKYNTLSSGMYDSYYRYNPSPKSWSIQIWDLEESRSVFCYDILEDSNRIYNISNIHITDNLVFVDRYHKIITIDINREKPVTETPKAITGSYEAISPDGKKAAVFEGSNIIIIDIENEEKIISMDRRGFHYTRSMEFSPDGRYLAAGSIFRIERGFINVNRVNGSIRLYDIEAGKMIRELKPPFDIALVFEVFVSLFS